MISVCIPNFNWNIHQLVIDLNKAADQSNVTVEILVSEDASTEFKEENASIAKLDRVSYFYHPENLGRAANRNYLAYKSQQPWLIFIDGDAALKDEQYFNHYLKAMDQSDVICGGTAYHEEPPEASRMLRWVYGREREELTADERNLQPNDSFSAFNFMIKKQFFDRLQFEEAIKGYGHEDTFFGLQIAHHGKTVWHIDNPLYHEGLDENSVFLEKTKQGIKNLVSLEKLYPELSEQVKLLRTYGGMQKFGGTSFLRRIAPLTVQRLSKRLDSESPSLKLFDLFKLLYLAQLKG